MDVRCWERSRHDVRNEEEEEEKVLTILYERDIRVRLLDKLSD